MTVMFNKLRAIRQLFGTTRSKARLWDGEYESGRWHTDKPKCDWPEFYEVINRYPGTLLELGCGDGLVAAGITCHEYTGIDISPVAIGQARDRCAKAGVNAIFDISDIDQFIPHKHFNVILFGESIYYLKNPVRTVGRYWSCVEPGGVIVMSVTGSVRADPILAKLSKICRVERPSCGVVVLSELVKA